MRAITIGQVVDSHHSGFAEGDLVHGTFGVQEFALSDGAGVYKVHPEEGRSLAVYLGVLGMTGMTAYFGLLDVGRIAAGDVVLVSGAAGAVGSAAGQIARIKGAHVIGIAGGPERPGVSPPRCLSGAPAPGLTGPPPSPVQVRENNRPMTRT